MYVYFICVIVNYIANLLLMVCNIAAQAAEMLLNIVTGADLTDC